MADIIFIFVTIFGVILLISSLCWTCRNRRFQVHISFSLAQDQEQAQAHVHAEVQQTEDKGLDQETIDSFPTVVIGESGRMLQQDDNTCPICLSEYHEYDVLKILPECVHRFHRDCLVEWLKLNATCPVCRTHPPHSSSLTS